jgi:enoyl-CoA hydratase
MLERYQEFKTLLVEQEGHLLSVTLNRPESLNAVGGGMHEELEELWPLLGTDDSVGAVLLTGAGRAFSSGGDVKGMAATAASGDKSVGRTVSSLLHGAKRLVMGMLEVEQPIVAAVQGYAMGLGATIALCSDVVIAAEDAVFGDTHVAIGLVAGDGGTVMWPMLLPINTAKYYLLTGDRLSGKDAERLGLVVRAVPADSLHAEAKAIAQKLADGPTMAIRFTKVAVNKILRERANLVFDTSLILEAATMHSDDHREAGAAFVEKRRPQFNGR